MRLLQAVIAALVGLFCIAAGVNSLVRIHTIGAFVVAIVFAFPGITCLGTAKSLLRRSTPQ